MPWWGRRHTAQHRVAGWESMKPLDFFLPDNLLQKSTWLTLPPNLAGRAYLHCASSGQSGRTEPGFPLEGHELCADREGDREGTGECVCHPPNSGEIGACCQLVAFPPLGAVLVLGAWQEAEMKVRLQTEDTGTISPELAVG